MSASHPLAKLEFFQGISDPAFWNALDQLPQRRLPAGSKVFEQGSRANELFILLSGSVDIVFRRQQGSEEKLAQLHGGALFGEFSLLTGLPRSSAAIATSEVTLLQVPGDWLAKQEANHPQLRKRLIELYRQRVLSNVLHANRLFGRLSAADIQQIVPQLQFKRYSTGEVLLAEGAEDTDLFVIKKGNVQVSKRQGKNVIALTQLGPGEVVGEMAIVTGEARSATVSALGEVEVMLLPGVALKVLLGKLPNLMAAIEELVSQRAAQTRKALEQLADEVMGAGAETLVEAEQLFLSVASLGIRLRVQSKRELQECVLTHLGMNRARFEWRGQALGIGEMLQLLFLPVRSKGLESMAGGEVSVVVAQCESTVVEITFGAELKDWLAEWIPRIAKAKVRLFVYPDYEVENLAITLQVADGSAPRKVVKLSQTALWFTGGPPLPVGQLVKIALHQQGKPLLNTQALVMAVDAEACELQFEYEGADEKSALESLVRQVTKALGFGKAVTSSEAPVASEQLPTVVARFKSRQEFVHAYTVGIEAGILRLPVPASCAVGSGVKIRLAVADMQSLRLSVSGKIQAIQEGLATIALDALSPVLRGKVEEICRELVAAKNAASKLERRQQLARSGVRIQRTPLQIGMHPAFVAMSALVLLGLAWAYRFGQNNDPYFDGAKKQLRLTVAGQSVRLRADEVTSIRRTLGSKTFQVTTANQTLQLPLEQKILLTEFQRQQLEALLAQQRKK